MNKFVIIILSASILMMPLACKKKSSGGMNYTVNGLTDMTATQYVDTLFQLPLTIAYNGGPQESLTITPVSLPSGVTVTPASLTGTPGFSGTFTFDATLSTTGVVPISLSVTSQSTGTKTLSFNLHVAANGDCAKTITGSYTGVDVVNGTGSNLSATVIEDAPNNFHIDIGNAILYGKTVCATGTVTTDSTDMSLNNERYSPGTGTYTAETITLNYKTSTSAGTVAIHSMTLTKH